MDISGLGTSVELLEMGPETDQAMLRYQVEYAEAFAFVFSLYSAKTLETAQKLHDKVERGARNHHNIITMSEYEKDGGMTVPVFLIGNRDGDLAPPQGQYDIFCYATGHTFLRGHSLAVFSSPLCCCAADCINARNGR